MEHKTKNQVFLILQNKFLKILTITTNGKLNRFWCLQQFRFHQIVLQTLLNFVRNLQSNCGFLRKIREQELIKK
ncbi:unnamed protein product [Paramecium sonneborni]|uniref:Uncharacterized protein n=1 Tax=Paramecium sonneborni TaxID=65129 RepID=A0A8S1P6R5_9CILI|nr:unnamed protein product [Paramecium sonneborni]